MKEIKNFIAEERKYYLQIYPRIPVLFVKAKGINIWDSQGKKYIDFFSGHGVSSLGYNHPEVIKAIKEQVAKILHTSNLFYTQPQIELARELCKISFAQKCFFANSGAEANEGAIKLARRYSQIKYGKNKYEIITALNSFHGRTLATVAATGQPKKKEIFKPLPIGFKHVPFNNAGSLKKAISAKTCAVMLEPIQGETGVYVAKDNYLKEVRQICDENNLLLILDEVQTGMGRTGKFFAYEHDGIKPDIMTLAKSLGGGIPLGAFLTSDKIAKAFRTGDHGSTFGGAAISCAAGLAVIKVIKEQKLLENVKKTGNYLMKDLKILKDQYPLIKEVRGKGLMIGIEFHQNVSAQIMKFCLDQGIIINSVAPNIIRLLPPFIITKKEIDILINTLDKAIKNIKK